MAGLKPLIVRLRNWVGDVVLSVPTLRRLEEQGYALHLVGKGFAPALLRGFDWRVYKLAPTFRTRVIQLRQLRRALNQPEGGPDCIVFPYSLSSALEARLSGLRACGFATEGRQLFLGQSLPRPRAGHTLEEYWALGSEFLHAPAPAPAPACIQWRVASEDVRQASELLGQHHLSQPGSPGFILAVPYASGDFGGQSKHWPGFSGWLETAYQTHGCPVVLCPGPGEEALYTFSDRSQVLTLPKVDLGVFAALAQRARLVISNDTGPGHLAAATGAATLSLLGPTPIERWGIRGLQTRTLQHQSGWPSIDEVNESVTDMLRRLHTQDHQRS